MYHGYNPSIPAKRRQRKHMALGSGLIPPPPDGGDVFIWLPGQPLPPFTVFQRSTEGSYYELEGGLLANDNRFVRYAAPDVIRDNHWEGWFNQTVDPFYIRTALLEEARTNLFFASEDFSDAAWTKIGATVVVDGSVAPDEALTMDKIVEDVANSQHGIQRTAAIAAGQPFSAFVFAKPAENGILRVKIEGDTVPANFGEITIDLSDQYGYNSSAGGVAVVDVFFFDSLINGSNRVGVSVTVGGADTAVKVSFLMLDAGGNEVYAGDGVSGMFFWGGQGEIGPTPTSYIRATGVASVLRDQDILVFPLTNNIVKQFSLQSSFVDKGLTNLVGANVWDVGNVAEDAPTIYLEGKGGQLLGAVYNDAIGTSEADPTDLFLFDQYTDMMTRFFETRVDLQYNLNGGPQTYVTGAPEVSRASNWSDPTGLFVRRNGSIALRNLIITSEPLFPLIPTTPPIVSQLALEDGLAGYSFFSLDQKDYVLNQTLADVGYAAIDDSFIGEEQLAESAGYVFMDDAI